MLLGSLNINREIIIECNCCELEKISWKPCLEPLYPWEDVLLSPTGIDAWVSPWGWNELPTLCVPLPQNSTAKNIKEERAL